MISKLSSSERDFLLAIDSLDKRRMIPISTSTLDSGYFSTSFEFDYLFKLCAGIEMNFSKKFGYKEQEFLKMILAMAD